jgi:hypothetical protein
MITYKMPPPFPDKERPPTCVIKIDGEVVTAIPISEDSAEYKEYIKWLEEGNEPLLWDE